MLATQPLPTDFTRFSLVPPERQRMTEPGATVLHIPPTYAAGRMVAAWASTGAPPGPLVTRYQPHNCRGREASTPRCTKRTGLSRFTPYEWHDPGRRWERRWEDACSGRRHPGNSTTGTERVFRGDVCIIGASHGRELARALADVTSAKIRRVYQGRGFDCCFAGCCDCCDRARVKYPSELANVEDADLVGCGVTIIGIGQWPASWCGRPEGLRSCQPARPMLVAEYMSEMERALARFAGRHDVVLRSVHYNPLGDLITAQPPEDWRNPLVIDAYNRVLKEVCRRLNLALLDTNTAVVAPMWDSASDWCHYRGKVAHAEARWIANNLSLPLNCSRSRYE